MLIADAGAEIDRGLERGRPEEPQVHPGMDDRVGLRIGFGGSDVVVKIHPAIRAKRELHRSQVRLIGGQVHRLVLPWLNGLINRERAAQSVLRRRAQAG